MKWNVDHLPAFVAVADQGGISAAARRLGAPKSTISRAMARLEEDVGLQLFVRNSRDLRLTHDGEQFYGHAVRILEQVDAATAELAGLSATPRGRLAVALPMAFSREVVGPRLTEFIAAFPDIQLDIQISSGKADLIRDQIDIAVVVGAMADSDLIQQRLITTPLIWIASPKTAQKLGALDLGHTINPKDAIAGLARHIKIVESRYATAQLSVKYAEAGHSLVLKSEQLLQVNDPLLVRDMVIAGGGLSFAPEIYCRAALVDGRLVRMFPDLGIAHESSLSLLYPSRRMLSKKARAFIEFLQNLCAETAMRAP